MARRGRAPRLVGRGGWVGVSSLSLQALRGKVVLLHFWAFGSAACHRVIEDLREVEGRFTEELAVVGVHSPKFPHEADHEAVVAAVARHRIAHPVLDDPDLATWERYGVRTWPSVVVIDPEGHVAGGMAGEGCGREAREVAAELVATHEERGTLRPAPLDVDRVPPFTPLSFPGKVAVSADGRRLAIADTGHDRVVVCSVEGVVLSAHTGFLHPQGVRFDEEGVVVCDTLAHRLVRSTGEVLADGMASPWDLVDDGEGAWIVAEAGRHRLLRVRPGEFRGRVVAGTGTEGLADGLAAKAELAQPAGVARTEGGVVVFSDAQSSSLRAFRPDQRGGQVSTLVGGGLFEWGGADGAPGTARLQHPLGVAASPGGGPVYVADTFNHALREWSDGAVRTLPVDGLDEPGGLDVLPDGRLVVADTNHHRIVIVDPSTGSVEPLDLDEGWVHAADGPPLSVRRGQELRLPVEVDLVDEELDDSGGDPLTVSVEARPPALLSDGAGQWRGATGGLGEVRVRAGAAGSGLVLVEVAAATRGAHDRARRGLRVQRRRYPVEVT